MMLTVNLPHAGRVVGQDPNLGGGSRSTRHHVPLGERSGEERAVMSGSQEVSAVHCQVDEKLVDRPQDTGLQPVGGEFVGIRHRSIFGSREPGVPREVVAMA